MEMDSYRIGTLLELVRTVAIDLYSEGLNVRVCVQGSMGEGAFTGLPRVTKKKKSHSSPHFCLCHTCRVVTLPFCPSVTCESFPNCGRAVSELCPA